MSKKKTLPYVMILFLILSIFSIRYFMEEKGKDTETFKRATIKPIEKPTKLIEKQLKEMHKLWEVPKSKVRVVATGDIMFHTPQLRSAYNPKDKSYNFYPMFNKIEKYIKDGDLAIGNFESVSSESDGRFTGYPTFNTPKTSLEALSKVGYDILSTANNHSLDRGKRGVIETIENINQYGMKNIGTYKEENNDILIENIKGIKIAMLSYSYGFNGLDSRLTKDEFQYMVNKIEEDKIKNDIKNADEQNADITIVVIHWGHEYWREPSEYQKELGDKMIDWGADIILGSHPHVIQQSKIIEHNGEKKFIIYSMGNFISNQRRETLSIRNRKYTEDGVIVNINLEKDFIENKTVISKIDYIPTWVYKYRKGNKYLYEIIPGHKSREDYNLIEPVISKIKESHKNTMEKMAR
ncbi:CapA family protein [Dethiothermospora halolimnae]|uniref:CapA family protein n=1 Tax=Dethiothermospora halolimnae TaxID=3114390 RepID=UPI003CCBA930